MSWYKILLQVLAAVTADAIICCICLFIFFRCKKVIKDRQRKKKRIKQREIERKRELAHHEYEVQFRMALRIWDLENKKVNKQTVILKGILCNPYKLGTDSTVCFFLHCIHTTQCSILYSKQHCLCFSYSPYNKEYKRKSAAWFNPFHLRIRNKYVDSVHNY